MWKFYDELECICPVMQWHTIHALESRTVIRGGKNPKIELVTLDELWLNYYHQPGREGEVSNEL